MNRSIQPRSRGRRDIIAIILLVVPLVALGYYLAAIEVAVDPPPDPVSGSTPTVVTTPVANPDDAPVNTTTPSSGDAGTTPTPSTSGTTPTRQHDAIATVSGTVLASRT